MAKTIQAQDLRGLRTPEQPGGNVIALPRKTAPAPAKPFSRTDDLEPHLLDSGHERNAAVYVALVLAMSHANPASHVQRDPLEALRKTRRALALLEIECAELGNTPARKGGAQ